MSNVLLVLTSPRGDSVSTKLATELANKIAAKSGGAVTLRDVAAKPLPHLDAELISATRSGKTDLTAHEKAAFDRAMEIIGEVKSADVVVIGAALFNFGPTTNLKGWIDHLAVPGQTFSYSAEGPEGLVKGKKVYVVTASAGTYGEGPGDYLKPWLTFALGFMGMSDVEVITVDKLAYGPDAVEKTMAAANDQIAAIAA
ncbi:MAG: NAD(P)H-dependent oxidoreductase [Rhizobiaceae bacterium]